MKRLALIFAVFLSLPLFAQPLFAQDYEGIMWVHYGSLSGACPYNLQVGMDATSSTFYNCTGGSWAKNTTTSVGAVPSGALLLLISGSCPASYTEVAALNGKFLQGTVAANGDVGSTGGNATITPVGTVAAPIFTGTPGTVPAQIFTGTPSTVPAETFTGTPGTVPAQIFTGTPGTVPAQIFTGSALAGHTHTVTPTGTNGATATTGNCAATNTLIGTGAANACKGTAPNLTVPAEAFTGTIDTSSSVSGGTPAGLNSTSAFTPTGANGTSAFTPAGVNGTSPFTPAGLNGTSAFTPAGVNSQPVFAGTPIDPRPPFIKVIFCSKN